MADLEQTLREGLRALWLADSPLAALMGGTVRVVDRNNPGPASALPAIGYEVLSFNPGSGEAQVLVTAMVDSVNAQDESREMLGAAETAITADGLLAQGIDGVPFPVIRQSANDTGDLRDLIEGAPNMRQADGVLPLLILTT